MNLFPPSPQSSGERGTGGEGPNRLETKPPHPQPFSPKTGRRERVLNGTKLSCKNVDEMFKTAISRTAQVTPKPDGL